MRIIEAVGQYERQLRANGRAERTVDAYLRALDQLARVLGDRDIDQVTPDELARFILSVQHRADGTLKAAITVNQTRTAVRMLFAYLVEAGALATNPAAALKMKPASSPERDILGAADQARLLETIAAFDDPAARRDYVMFSVLLGTGLRLSSLVGLDVADVDLRRQRLDVVVKGGHRETAVLSRRLMDLLTPWVEGKAGPLFCSNRGTRISTRQVQQRLEHWLEAAGVEADVTVHGLRHTFGTRLYAATSDLRLVQAALHHRHVSTTERYARVAESRLREAVEAVG